MASLPPSSPPPSPPSASKSEHSATQPAPPLPQVDAAPNSGVVNEIEQKPDLTMDHFAFRNSADYIAKYKNYQADYTRHLMTKYFSKKNLYGGVVFDEKMTIEDETIMSSRWPCPRSFADPVRSFEDQSSSGSTPTEEDQTTVSNGKPPTPKKSG